MAFHNSKQTLPQYARMIMAGEPGVGKTLMASTDEHSLILDLENRAAHAGRNRFTFTKDSSGLKELQGVLKKLTRLKPNKDGLLDYPLPDGGVIQVGTVVIDSLDELQLNIDMTLTSTGFDYWREMLQIARNIITQARTINAHLVCVCHTKVFATDDVGTVKIAKVDLALTGALKTQIPGWFDLILNMVYNPKAEQRQVITQPTVINGMLYAAKDATHLFGGRKMAFTFIDGRPDPAIMETVYNATSGGVVKMVEDPGALTERIEEQLKNATEQPLKVSDFTAYCEAQDWELTDEIKAAITKEFGEGYDPYRGRDYIAFLRKLFGAEMESEPAE